MHGGRDMRAISDQEHEQCILDMNDITITVLSSISVG